MLSLASACRRKARLSGRKCEYAALISVLVWEPRLNVLRRTLSRGFEICIDGLSIWRMRIGREIGRGTSVQALRERRSRQERADAHQAALPVQSLRPELHRHTR